MGVTVPGYSPEALSRSTRLVRAYAESGDGNVSADVAAILDEIGRDQAELRNLIASLAGLAGHAVRSIAVRLEADLGGGADLETKLPKLSEQRSKVLAECAEALRSWADTRERRSGLDRRLTPDRRHLAPHNPKEQVNLRLYGERRGGVADRRSGLDRRGLGEVAMARQPSVDARPNRAARHRPRLGVRGHVGGLLRPRP